jgi:hypothetical protein
MKWVTRERPKIDRLACPWLILRFIDRVAKIRYVPTAHVLTVVGSEGAIPFDRTGATDSEQKVRKIRCTTLTGLDPKRTLQRAARSRYVAHTYVSQSLVTSCVAE